MDTAMDTNMQPKGRHHRRRNNNFTYLDKSSSEPDLTEFNSLSSRWRKGPTEFITVDELKFYRRRRPPDQLHNNINTAPTSSSFSLYNKSEPYVPFSALKTEYQRQYGGGVSPTPQRATLRRRSTSLKLPARQRLSATDADGGIGDADLLDLTMGESEQHAEYHPYTEDEQSQCRRTLAHRPDHQFVDAAQPNLHFDGHLSIQPTTAATVDIDPKNVAAAGSVTPNEPHGIASKHRTLLGGGQHAAERCHLHLSGELSYAPEYRSQFVGFPAPIEKSHSIPQLSNIRFQGKFGGVAEYRDSFREYDRYARCAPIRNPGHLRTAGAVATTATTASEAKSAGEYAEKFQAPLAPERVVRAHRQEDQFSLTPVAGDVGGGTAATRSTERTAPVDMAKPVRGRPKCDFLALKGSMEYNPEYRCTYVDFPRTRPITNKPPSNIKLGDHNSASITTTPSHHRKPARSPQSRHHHADAIATTATTTTATATVQPMLQPINVHDHRHLSQPAAHDALPFMCPPEVRRARQDLLLKKRPGQKEIISTSQTVEFGSVGNALVADAPAVVPLPPTGGASPRLAAASPRHSSPVTFRLTVQNVDDPGGGTFKKTTPKFGRRSSVLVKESHRLRNRSRIVEGNREYAGGGQQHQQQQPHPHAHSRKVSSTSFVVLKEPCKQSRWLKTSWYS